MTQKGSIVNKSHLKVDTEVKNQIEDLKVVLGLKFNYEVVTWLLSRGIESLDPKQKAAYEIRQKLREL